jgi:hypothetical protein
MQRYIGLDDHATSCSFGVLSEEVSVVCLGQGDEPKSPRVGYAPSEYQKKPWPREALIEGWFPLIGKEQTHFHHGCDVMTDSQPESEEQDHRFDDDRDAATAEMPRSAREDLKTPSVSCALASTQRLAPCDGAPRHPADAVRSKTHNARRMDTFVLDATFDRKDKQTANLRLSRQGACELRYPLNHRGLPGGRLRAIPIGSSVLAGTRVRVGFTVPGCWSITTSP